MKCSTRCLNVTLCLATQCYPIFSQHDFWVQSLITCAEKWSQGVRLNSMTYAIEHNTVSYIYDLEWGH